MTTNHKQPPLTGKRLTSSELKAAEQELFAHLSSDEPEATSKDDSPPPETSPDSNHFPLWIVLWNTILTLFTIVALTGGLWPFQRSGIELIWTGVKSISPPKQTATPRPTATPTPTPTATLSVTSNATPEATTLNLSVCFNYLNTQSEVGESEFSPSIHHEGGSSTSVGCELTSIAIDGSMLQLTLEDIPPGWSVDSVSEPEKWHLTLGDTIQITRNIASDKSDLYLKVYVIAPRVFSGTVTISPTVNPKGIPMVFYGHPENTRAWQFLGETETNSDGRFHFTHTSAISWTYRVGILSLPENYRANITPMTTTWHSVDNKTLQSEMIDSVIDHRFEELDFRVKLENIPLDLSAANIAEGIDHRIGWATEIEQPYYVFTITENITPTIEWANIELPKCDCQYALEVWTPQDADDTYQVILNNENDESTRTFHQTPQDVRKWRGFEESAEGESLIITDEAPASLEISITDLKGEQFLLGPLRINPSPAVN